MPDHNPQFVDHNAIRVGAHLARLTSSPLRVNHASYVLAARELPYFHLGERIDIREWPVFADDGRLVGAVEKLMVDPSARKVRYLSVSLIKEAVDDYRLIAPGSVLVPIGRVRRIDDREVIKLAGLASRALAAAPRMATRRAITRDDEDRTLAVYGMLTSREVSSSDFYKRPDFDEGTLGGSRG